MREYDHRRLEKEAQEKWAENDLFRSVEDTGKEKIYVLDMFPYPSGEGLHVGHPKGYIATDIYSRHKRMQGHAVLHPMGWDAFGLPAENFALKHKVHPRVAVDKNIANFKEQLAHIGFDYDWSREINTTDPKYYKWTQWIFLKLLEHGLAYQSNEPINWCPSCLTGLANEDLDGNVCERCGTPVEKKRLPQWVLKITDYADRMLADLDMLKWPEHIKEAQRNWIGRSEGAEISFPLAGHSESITIFTTRPDTIYGATYVVLAPEHPLVGILAKDIKNSADVAAYVKTAARKTEIERTTDSKEKTGVRLEGVMAVNPATKEEIPIYIADYVLNSYGTGAIMAVPAHDERDFAFAKKHNLPIKQIIEPEFVATGERDPETKMKPDQEIVKREAICAVIRNPRDDTYLCINWKRVLMHGLVTGGIEEGEDMVETAKREIREETGYKNVRLVKNPDIAINTFFYHRIKKQNRWARFHYLYFELENEERDSLHTDDEALHEVVWKRKEELKDYFTVFEGDYTVALLENDWNPLYTGAGILGNSGSFSGQDSQEAMWGIVKAVGGTRVTRYKLRDWIFSRQRYWGEPIPIIHCEKDGAVPVPYEDLPVLLPDVKSYEPTGTGESPLAAITDWVNTTCPKCGEPAKRETNTMPQWAGSSWYYLRFMDPDDDEQLVSTKREKYWAPVDVYVGGDHAVRHLIYARFWHKFLYDIGVVSTKEPFARLEFLGFILAEDGRKMSKRYGNVINPDDVVKEYGADAFRLYEMFMGPFENTTAWNTASIAGVSRFVERVWKMQDRVVAENISALETPLHQTIKKVTEDIEAFKFNTAVSQLMIFLNSAEEAGSIGKEAWKSYLKLLAPFAPHITEKLWAELKEEDSIHHSTWPTYDEAMLRTSSVTVAVQVGGKRRGAVELSPEASEEEAVSAARRLPAVEGALGGKTPSRVVYIPGKILNLVP